MAYWNRWHEQATATGVPAHLADLGRQMMRDNFQHGLGDSTLGEECDGPLMLAMCLAAPLQAEMRLLVDLYHRQLENVDGAVIKLIAQRMALSDEVVERLLEAELPAYQAAWTSQRR